jgi:hypothetical protein
MYSPITTTPSIVTVPASEIDLEDEPCGTIAEGRITDTSDIYTLLARQHAPFVYNVVPNNWMGQYALWKSLLADSTLADSSDVIHVFDSMAQLRSRFKYLTDIERDLANGEIDSALVKLGYDIDSMANTDRDSATQVQMGDDVAADDIVENHRLLYHLYIKYVTISMDGTDSVDLMTLAALCPERNGAVVYQARALYTMIYNDMNFFYDDSCMDADTTYVAAKPGRNQHNSTVTTVAENQKYYLYPNPNSGNFILQQMVADNTPTTVTVYDVVGRSIYHKQLNFVDTKQSLDVGNAAPGVYLLELKDSRNRIYRFKFVITK